MSTHASEHEARAAEAFADRPAHAAVLTVSDTRSIKDDQSGALIQSLLEKAGHIMERRSIVPDEPQAIGEQIDQWLAVPEVQVILTTGGTGIARRDTTIEVVRSRITKELDGFGELFRMLSYKEVGAAAMLSRAVAGLAGRDAGRGDDVFLFAMPGSTNAVELAMSRLILPQLPHLLWERSR